MPPTGPWNLAPTRTRQPGLQPARTAKPNPPHQRRRARRQAAGPSRKIEAKASGVSCRVPRPSRIACTSSRCWLNSRTRAALIGAPDQWVTNDRHSRTTDSPTAGALPGPGKSNDVREDNSSVVTSRANASTASTADAATSCATRNVGGSIGSRTAGSCRRCLANTHSAAHSSRSVNSAGSPSRRPGRLRALHGSTR
jgi:hypothetical protein